MPPAPSASGELWGFHLMPAEVCVDCMLPNGVFISVNAHRDATLSSLKLELWAEARKLPLYHKLQAPSSYVFVSVTHDGEREEFYDETRRLCDLRLFLPALRLVEPAGNREEKMLNYDISITIGRPLSELDEIISPEVLLFRQKMFEVVQEACEQRTAGGFDPYKFSVDIGGERREEEEPPLKNITNQEIVVCVWGSTVDDLQESAVQSSLSTAPPHPRSPVKNGKNKVTVKVPIHFTPKELIAESLYRRSRKFSHGTQRNGTNVVIESALLTTPPDCANYILKVAGCQVFLLHEKALSSYGYIRKCVNDNLIPHLMLMSAEDLMQSTLGSVQTMIRPSLLRRQASIALPTRENSQSLWEMDTLFKLRVVSASSINAGDVDKIYVKVGLYHGPEEICVKDTRMKPIRDPRWNDMLEFSDIYVPDIPLAMQLCLSLCSMKQRGKQKAEQCALAWANVRLFDFVGQLRSGHLRINLWPFPRQFEGFLNPLGHIGSNPDRDSPSIDLDFDNYGPAVVFPPRSQIQDYVRFAQNTLERKQPQKAAKKIESVTPEEIVLFETIIQRDPLAEMSDLEMEHMWRLRLYCKSVPHSLPRLLDAITWTNRDEVSQIYALLEDWPIVAPEVALELLHVRYPDTFVRQFAIRCLEAKLSNDKLELYLVSLIQVLKYEPFMNNDLTRFLLKRALLDQRIGHLFFWNLRSEIGYNVNWLRFALILEAYCRGCGAYLKSLIRQVDAVEKLTSISLELKDRKEEAKESTKVLQEKLLLQADCREALEAVESPLNCCHVLGALEPQNCRVVDSAKRPIWLVWKNPDPLADLFLPTHELIFKCGDDLRQDMLTLQMFKIMDRIWKMNGHDFKLTPYSCLSTGKQSGIIEVVQKAKTILQIQRSEGMKSAFGSSSTLHNWLKNRNKGEKYDQAIDTFTRSCAGYCVATFVLGIRDRHQSNIMMTEDGHIFHIDFGHFLGHYKKKFGINRERVPFVLTEDFIRVIARGAENPKKSGDLFEKFQEMCSRAYLILHQNANLFLTLFAMMLCMGIPELQRIEDVSYLRRTLATELSDEEAIKYFNEQLCEAYAGGWTTKADWMMHFIRHM